MITIFVNDDNDEHDYRCGERDVVCGAGDAASRGGGAVTNWQLLEVQPDQDGDVGDDGGGGGEDEGDEDEGELKAPDLTNPLVHSFDQVDTSTRSVVLARVARILKKKSFLAVHPWVQQMKPQGEQIRLVLSP